MTQWIKCSDRLPEVKKIVLVVRLIIQNEKIIELGRLGKISNDTPDDLCWWDSSNEQKLGKITHWMPLPELPEEE